MSHNDNGPTNGLPVLAEFIGCNGNVVANPEHFSRKSLTLCFQQDQQEINSHWKVNKFQEDRHWTALGKKLEGQHGFANVGWPSALLLHIRTSINLNCHRKSRMISNAQSCYEYISKKKVLYFYYPLIFSRR